MDIPVLNANTIDPDQMPHSVASDFGLHCLLITRFVCFPTTMGKFRFYVCKDQSPLLDCTLIVSYCLYRNNPTSKYWDTLSTYHTSPKI